MAYDEGLAQLLRDELATEVIKEKKMFGGLAFLLNGHMVCGVHKGGAMFRVGKESYAKALSIEGVTEMDMGGRPMTGMVQASDETCANDDLRGQLFALSLATVRALPPKT